MMNTAAPAASPARALAPDELRDAFLHLKETRKLRNRDVAQLLGVSEGEALAAVAGERVVVHLRFRGHFTGRFGPVQGKGQAIDFIATDIYRIERGRIAENWHIEDNLTLLRELGIAA